MEIKVLCKSVDCLAQSQITRELRYAEFKLGAGENSAAWKYYHRIWSVLYIWEAGEGAALQLLKNEL